MFRFQALTLVAVILSSLHLNVEGADVGWVHDPRPHHWVSDETGQISSEVVDSIDRLGGKFGGEMAVAVVRSTHGIDSRTFAVELFRHWGLGSAKANDGVLIFVALTDRKAEIVLGSGVDDARYQRGSDRAMTKMIAQLKRGNPSQAVWEAANSLATDFDRLNRPVRLPAATPQRAAATNATRQPVPAKVVEAESVHFDLEREGDSSDQTVKVEREVKAADRGVAWWPIGLGSLGLGSVTLLGLTLVRRLFHRQLCDECRFPMTLLDEEADDEHLADAEIVEEQLGSVNYDVWACQSCGNVLKIRRGKFFTRYSKCPGCNAKTRSETTETLEHATEYAQGRVLVTEQCANCSYQRQETRMTPVLESSSGIASTGISSGFGNSSFGSNSLGSGGFGAGGFGGGGFGGGDTSGGGSSGSW